MNQGKQVIPKQDYSAVDKRYIPCDVPCNAARNCHREDICMTRLMLALAALIGLVSVGSATLTPRKESPLRKEVPAFGHQVPRAGDCKPPSRGQAQARGPQSEFVVTHRTKVLLNGKPCKYKDVPDHARIVRMEVAADKKTVLKVYFRTGK
jgi:hypothetical protein